MALPFSNHIFTVFEETLNYVTSGKSTCSGAIIRPELFNGDRDEGLRMANLPGKKPVLIIMGGSQGSVMLNDAVREDLPAILQDFEIIHLCGKGNLAESLEGIPCYSQFEYVTVGLQHLLAASNFAVSRAGSNAIFELLAIRKPMLLIPLSASKSRGDQILNALHFKSLGLAQILQEEEVGLHPLSQEFASFSKMKDELIENMKKVAMPKTPEKMVEMIMAYRK